MWMYLTPTTLYIDQWTINESALYVIKTLNEWIVQVKQNTKKKDIIYIYLTIEGS